MLPAVSLCIRSSEIVQINEWMKKEERITPCKLFTNPLSKLPHDPSRGISRLSLYRRPLGCLSDASIVYLWPVVKLLFELVVRKCGACLSCVVSILLLQRNDLQGKCSQSSNGVLKYFVFCAWRPKIFAVCLISKCWGSIRDRKSFPRRTCPAFHVEWINKHLAFRHQWERERERESMVVKATNPGLCESLTSY